MAPPVCFVRPTAGTLVHGRKNRVLALFSIAEMMIRPRHPHVSKEGFIVVPYLTDWQEVESFGNVESTDILTWK